MPTFTPAVNLAESVAPPVIESTNRPVPPMPSSTTHTFPAPADSGHGIGAVSFATTPIFNPPVDPVFELLGAGTDSSILTETPSQNTLILNEPESLGRETETSAIFNRATGAEAIYSGERSFTAARTDWLTWDLTWAEAIVSANRPIDRGEVGIFSSSLAAKSLQESASSSVQEIFSGELLDDEYFLDIAEVLDDGSRSQPCRLPIGERDVDEHAKDDYSPTSSATPHNWNDLYWLLQRSDCIENPDDGVVDESQDIGEQGSTTGREDAESGMIELSHYHSPLAPRSAHDATMVVDVANVDGIGRVEFVKTDSSCPRYQAFEVASQPVDLPEPILDEDSGESASSAGLPPTGRDSTSDDNSFDTDAHARNASSSAEAPAASALLVGFFWSRRARRHRSLPQSA